MMRLSTLLPAALATGSFLGQSRASDLDDYITTQTPISENGLLNNTGLSAGAALGVVAVSTQIGIPEIAYTWIRDAALVYDFWIDRLTLGDTTLRSTLDDMVAVLTKSQHVRSPSGNVTTGGLAEPRFHLDLSPDLGPFTRPENDGPALRAINLMKYANWLLDNENGTWVYDNLWPAIDLNLNWIAYHWPEESYELWETVYTQSYWTAAVQYRMLTMGVALGHRIKRDFDEIKYEGEALKILMYMQTFWDAEQGCMRGNTAANRTGIDSAALLLSIFNYDQSAGCDPLTFQPCSDRALSNLKVTIDSFRRIYPISSNISVHKPVPIGLFPEDTTGGGQPWFFSIFGAAEQLYDALWTWDALGHLSVTPVSHAFFASFAPNITLGVYAKASQTYRNLTDAIRTYADEFILLCAQYTPPGSVLVQGFDKVSGAPFGVPGLSRSLSASLTAFNARGGLVPAPWGAVNAIYIGAAEES
ncbi:glycoside hydrolase family 15 protein [Artomyces pyxidatus]|uniref:Glycoside hydrolase family 15 protein n=1 Tax=Artomyces pyxidatus TaxID=48021 RepID=A0ACB8T813_9AGAM|nr:glycoside hydrolase family 15 protein [Artomyces pyxidatus]